MAQVAAVPDGERGMPWVPTLLYSLFAVLLSILGLAMLAGGIAVLAIHPHVPAIPGIHWRLLYSLLSSFAGAAVLMMLSGGSSMLGFAALLVQEMPEHRKS